MLAYLKGRGLAEGIDPSLVANRSDVIDLATTAATGLHLTCRCFEAGAAPLSATT